MISLHQLRTFVEVVRAGSVRGAAERLVVSQPAVSAALSALARETGAVLFERDGRGIRLTEAGRTLERYARRVLALIDEGTQQVRAAEGKGVALRLGAVTTVAEHVLPELLRGFRAQLGDVTIELQVANRLHIWQLLENWEIDLVLAGRPPPRESFVTLAERPNELVVVTGLGAWPTTTDQLGKETWLLREPGSGTRATSEELIEALAISPQRLTIGSNGAIREGVMCGLGIALLSRDAVRRELDEGILDELPTPLTPLSRAWNLVASTDRELTPTAAEFVSYLLAAGNFTAIS